MFETPPALIPGPPNWSWIRGWNATDQQEEWRRSEKQYYQESVGQCQTSSDTNPNGRRRPTYPRPATPMVSSEQSHVPGYLNQPSPLPCTRSPHLRTILDDPMIQHQCLHQSSHRTSAQPDSSKQHSALAIPVPVRTKSNSLFVQGEKRSSRLTMHHPDLTHGSPPWLGTILARNALGWPWWKQYHRLWRRLLSTACRAQLTRCDDEWTQQPLHTLLLTQTLSR